MCVHVCIHLCFIVIPFSSLSCEWSCVCVCVRVGAWLRLGVLARANNHPLPLSCPVSEFVYEYCWGYPPYQMIPNTLPQQLHKKSHKKSEIRLGLAKTI